MQHEKSQARNSLRAADPEAAPPPGTTVGNYVGLCLLVEFPDVPHTISRQEVDHFCNQTGYTGFGNNGSVRDYFYEVSDIRRGSWQWEYAEDEAALGLRERT